MKPLLYMYLNVDVLCINYIEGRLA